MSYREQVEQNLEKARLQEKTNNPKASIILIVISLLFGVNAFCLLFRGKGIILRFIDPTICGILSAVIAVAGVFMGCKYLLEALQNRKPEMTAKRMGKYLEQIRAFGNEEDVFQQIEAIEPIRLGSIELRYNQNLIAATSSEEVENTFFYPISALSAAGLSRLGSGLNFYLHAVVNGKKHIHSFTVLPGSGMKILNDLQQIRPDLKIELPNESGK